MFPHVVMSGKLVCQNQMVENVPYSNLDSPGLTQIGPLPWQAKQTVSALCQPQPATQLGQSMLDLANLGQNTVVIRSFFTGQEGQGLILEHTWG